MSEDAGALSPDLKSVFDASPDPVVVIDRYIKYVYVNGPGARLLGFASPEETVARGSTGQPPSVVVLDARGAPLPWDRLANRHALKGEHPPPQEVRFRNLTTGEESWVVMLSTPLFDSAGQVRLVATTIRDITRQRRSSRSLRFLAEASATLSTSLDYATTLRALARLVVPDLADLCAVEVFEEDGSQLREVTHVDPVKEAAARELWQRYPLPHPGKGRAKVMSTGMPEFIPNIPLERLTAAAKDPEQLRLLHEVSPRAMLSVPLRTRERVVGTLTLALTDPARRFDEADLELAQELGFRAALAVDNARLYREAQAALARKELEARINDTLQRLGTSFASELDPDRLIQRIIHEATLLIGAHFGTFHAAADVGLERADAGAPDDAAARAALAWCSALFAAGFPLQGVLRADNAPVDIRLAGRVPPEVSEVRSLLAVPVLARSGERVGLLAFGHPRPGMFTIDHERVLTSIAAQAAVALDNARLFRELHNTQAQLRASEERQRLALAAGKMGYFDWDFAAARCLLSPRFEEILGLPAGSSDGSLAALKGVLHPEDAAWVSERLQRHAREGIEDDRLEYRVVRPDGEVRWLDCYNKVVKDEQGRSARMLGVVLDATERRASEEKVNQLVKELVRSNGELEQFAYVASHDLQEPLRMVASYTQLLSRRYQGKLDADADEFIRYAVEGVGRMRRLITDLLAYSRAGSQTKELEPTHTQAVLDRALGNLAMAIDDARAEVTSDPLPDILGDEVQLEQLFQNLIGNALKFRGQAPPKVHVGAQRRENEWIFSVKDNGIGIDPQYFERIFIIFQRLHTSNEYSGTGLGLAICKKIVERHGGRIWVESKQGEGATFFFSVPARVAAGKRSRVA